MAVLSLLTVPDERLGEVCEPVVEFDADLRRFVADLEDTRRAGPAAVGIAAPQVGRLQRVVILDVPAKKGMATHGHLILVNPEIVHWEGFEVGREGCLSVPDYTGNVIRASRLQLRAQSLEGTERELEMAGFEARVAQHEIDHLDGLLFIDRVVSRRTDLFRRKVYRPRGRSSAGDGH